MLAVLLAWGAVRLAWLCLASLCNGLVTPIAEASIDLRFAAAVAAFAQQLRSGQYTGDFVLADPAVPEEVSA